ncbi:MAG: hypothetical protein SO424_06140 [[Pasteurella] aerogenes]|nr:hypothetical protein [[Pasteurella] aerogenes]
MKKIAIIVTTMFLSACANDWSLSGVPDMHEGQSQESVLKALQKNNWVIKKQYTDKKGNLYLIAQGKPTEQFAGLFGTDCRQGSFAILKKEGLQVLETSACQEFKK